MKFRTLIGYYLAVQTIIIIVTVIAQNSLPLRETFIGRGTQSYNQNILLYSRANFDGNHYLWIADNSYGYGEQAFFPLYSSLVKIVRDITKLSTVASGVLVANVSFILMLYVLARLLSLDFSPRITKITVLTMLFFPVSFFFSFVYTESIFLLLVLLTFYFARTKNWLLAGIFGALAANARFVGIFLFPALLAEWYLEYRSATKTALISIIPIFFIPFGLFSYMLYLHTSVGDPLAFVHTQALFGQMRSEKIILIYQVFWRYLKIMLTFNRADPLYFSIILELLTAIIFLITSIYSLLKSRLSYAIFNISAYLLPTLTGSFASMPRYVLVCFPSFIILAHVVNRLSPISQKVIAIASFILSVIYLSLFIRGYWVA